MIRATALSLALIVVAHLAAEPPCELAKAVTEAGVRYTDGRRYNRDQANEVGEAASHYVRVNLRVENAAAGKWFLEVRDKQHRLIETLTPEDFAKTPSRWTARVPGPYAKFELLADPDAERQVAIFFDYFIVMPAVQKAQYYSLQKEGAPAYISLYEEPKRPVEPSTRRLGDFVGMLLTSSGGKHKPSWTCSGVMISPALFLTNWHCGAPNDAEEADFWTSTVLREAVIDLSWDEDALSRDYGIAGLVASDRELDYALLSVAPIGGSPLLRAVTIDRRDVETGEAIRLIHHPLSAQKKLSVCTVFGRNFPSWIAQKPDSDFTYKCDTEAGSSGGPIFDAAGRLIGLHHRGFLYDEKCNRLDKLNKAVKIREILSDVDTKKAGILGSLSFVAH